MEPPRLRNKVLEEVKLLPEEKLAEVYDFIHYFRLGLEASESKNKQIMRFAGCWKEMSDEVFVEFSNEIVTRRQQAFSGRRRSETSAD